MQNNTEPEREPIDEALQGYIGDQIKLVKLEAAEKVSILAGRILMALILVTLVQLVLVTCGLGIVLALGTKEFAYLDGVGYAVGLYVLLGILVYTAREKLIELPVANFIIKKLYQD